MGNFSLKVFFLGGGGGLCGVLNRYNELKELSQVCKYNNNVKKATFCKRKMQSVGTPSPDLTSVFQWK